MDIIKELAEEYSEDLKYSPQITINLESFDLELRSKLSHIIKNSEKMRFLLYLRDLEEEKYKNHIPICKNPEDCVDNRIYEIALYSINQQYEDYLKIEGYSNIVERPAMYFFNEGQYFDAFTAIIECIKVAKKSIVLIDGYVDENTLAFFPAKEPNIKLRILTNKKAVNPTFERAIELYNKQFHNLKIEFTDSFHDRFLIIDNVSFYHIGASIKDAGNKTFIFTKIEEIDIQDLLRSKILKEWNDVYS